MFVEEHKASARRSIDEVWNKGHLDVLDELYAADMVHHRPPFENREGLPAFKQYIADTRRAYPDLHVTIDRLTAEGLMVVIQWTFCGTFTGRSLITSPTTMGMQVTFTGCTIARQVGQHTVESWEYTDYLGLMQQLGMILPPTLGER